jgi:hypothetical protein
MLPADCVHGGGGQGAEQTPTTSAKAGWAVTAGEAGAGLVGSAFPGAGLATGGYWLGTTVTRSLRFELEAKTLSVAGGIAGVWFGTTIGTCLVGRTYRQAGSCQWTCCGALAGTLVGAPIALLGISLPPSPRWRRATAALVTFGALMPSTGAVLGYNLSRPKAGEARASRLRTLEFAFSTVAARERLDPTSARPAPPQPRVLEGGRPDSTPAIDSS